MHISNRIVVISGPTASGKTSYSIDLAKKNNGVIINADSMQIYRDLPILSAQPRSDERESIEHLLFSHFKPTENCNVGLWLKLAKTAIDNCLENGKTPIVVGGTGMYISKLINGISQIPEINQDIRTKITNLYQEIGYEKFYKKALSIDEKYVKKLNLNDKQRLIRVIEVFEISGKNISYFQSKGNIKLYEKDLFFHININLPRNILYERCLLRFKTLIEKYNIIDEVKNFINKYPEIINNIDNYSSTKTIGFRECLEYLNGTITLENFVEKSVKLTRNYAKRQYTWFNNQFEKFDLEIS